MTCDPAFLTYFRLGGCASGSRVTPRWNAQPRRPEGVMIETAAAMFGLVVFLPMLLVAWMAWRA